MKTSLRAAIAATIFGLSSSAYSAPAKPTISWMPADYEQGASVSVTWNMWWGDNGTSWQLHSGADVLCEGTLTDGGNAAQTASCTVSPASGAYDLQVALCDASGCTESAVKAINVAGGTTTPPVNVAPQVTALAPVAGSIAGDVISLQASATDSDGSINSVEFFVNSISVGSDATAPYAFSWTSVAGTHNLSAKATDDKGAQTTSANVSFVVDADNSTGANVAPTVSVNQPAEKTEGQTVILEATANDVDGAVSSVEFFIDNVKVGTSYNAPFNFLWEAVVGPHDLSAKATDDKGATTLSTALPFIVLADNGTAGGPQPLPGGGYSLTQAEIDAAETDKTSSDLFKKVKASIATLDNALVEAIVPGATANPENVKRVEAILSDADFEFHFPMREPTYTYTRFLRAVGKFQGFCATYTDGRDSDAICRKSMATMFAHFTQETGGHDANSAIPEWRQGLVHLSEMGCSQESSGCGYNTECNPDYWQGVTWPCGTDAQGNYMKYYGRGAKQLSYNYNYGPFSAAMFDGDVSVLLNDPNRVAETWLNLASAVFFFVTPQAPKPSMLHVIDGTWQPNAHDLSLGLNTGFGVTTNIINGGIECTTSYEKPQSVNRIAYYKGHAAALNVPIAADEQLGCVGQERFDVQGAGALLINWEQDWTYHADRPEGKAFECKLVGYQTAYNAFTIGDYQACVEHYFDVTVLP